MILLALDISKRSTGVAIGDGSRAPALSALGFEGGNLGQIGWTFQRWLRDQLVAINPVLVILEKPFVGKTDDLWRQQLMLGLGFVAQTTAAMRRIPVKVVAVQTWRKAFLGYGRPTSPKEATIRMCQMLKWPCGKNDDMADAAGIWAWGHLHHGNRRGMHRMLSMGAVKNFS